jgi:hypothetical protein
MEIGQNKNVSRILMQAKLAQDGACWHGRALLVASITLIALVFRML